MNRDNFRIRWEGYLVPPVSGEYEFDAEVDDFLEVKLDGKAVLRDRRESNAVGKVALEAGVPVPIEVDFVEEYGDAHVRLFWKPPGGRREAIPSSVLLPVGEGVAEVVADGEATDPRGQPRSMQLSIGRRGRVLEVDGAAIPGLYDLQVPSQLRREVEELRGERVPLVVRRDVRESRLDSLSDDDRTLIRNHIDLVEARNVNDLMAVLSGKGFGQELWRVLAVAAFFLLLLEVALARWISKSRRTAEEVKVEFEERGGPDAAFVEQMEKLKKVG